MNPLGIQDKDKVKKERAKKAVALAMKSRWEEAATVNRAIIKDFPGDLEAYNRLGKAQSELGNNREAIEAFQRALKISPHNGIAKKNVARLSQLGGDSTQTTSRNSTAAKVFIEESGKSGVTSLISLALSTDILKLAPGHSIQLQIQETALVATVGSGELVGKVEPKLASRLIRLMKGGNRYESAVTSASKNELHIIIREVYKHPSQSGVVSFPPRGSRDYQMYVPNPVIDYDLTDTDPDDDTKRSMIKDWSDDDTEPGDDEAFTPVFHRIINSDGDEVNEDDY